jgi:hypothetical protein
VSYPVHAIRKQRMGISCAIEYRTRALGRFGLNSTSTPPADPGRVRASLTSCLGDTAMQKMVCQPQRIKWWTAPPFIHSIKRDFASAPSASLAPDHPANDLVGGDRRSMRVSRSRRACDRSSTWSWCRNARTSSCSVTRKRPQSRSVSRSATTTDISNAYPRSATTSMLPTRTEFLVGTSSISPK